MKVIKVEEILVDDDVYAALEREVKELNNLTTSFTLPFEVTIGHVIDMVVNDYGKRLLEEQRKADALAYTE